MPLFRRHQEPGSDPVDARLTEFRAATVAAPEPPISDLLQELEVPYQRRGGVWLVEVGGAWATLAWIAIDASLMCHLDYEEPPGPSTDLVRANSETGLAWYDAGGDALITRVMLPAEDVHATGLALALATLRRESGGPGDAPLEGDAGVEAALTELSTDTSGIAIVQRGDILDLRIELGSDVAPDEALAHWMLEVSGMRGARLGIDDAGTLYAIAAIPARPVSTGGLAWALSEVRGLAEIYRAA